MSLSSFNAQNPILMTFSTSPMEVDSGIINLRSLISSGQYEIDPNDELIFQKLYKIITDNDVCLRIKQHALELISEMCQANPIAKRKFWHTKIQIKLLEYLSDKNTMINFSTIVDILSMLVEWTSTSMIKLLEMNYLGILIDNLSCNSMSVLESALNGILHVINNNNINFFKLKINVDDYVKLIFNGLLNFIDSEYLLLDTTGKTFEILNCIISYMNIDLDILDKPLKKGLEILRNNDQHKRTSLITTIISFFCNCIYNSNEFAYFLIHEGILDIFHKLLNLNYNDELIINSLKTISNCSCISIQLKSIIAESPLLADAYEYLKNGSIKVKIESLYFFQNIFNYEFLIQQNNIAIFDSLPDFFTTLSDILFLEQEKNMVILSCLQLFFNAILMYEHFNYPQLSPPILSLIKNDGFDEMEALSFSENKDIVIISGEILKRIKNSHQL